MKKSGVLDRYKRSRDEELSFAEEAAMAQVAVALADLLERCAVSQRELANRIGVTEGRVSQILAANSNPTVRTVARLAHAMGRRLQVEFVAQPTFHGDFKPWPHTARNQAQLLWTRSNDETEAAPDGQKVAA